MLNTKSVEFFLLPFGPLYYSIYLKTATKPQYNRKARNDKINENNGIVLNVFRTQNNNEQKLCRDKPSFIDKHHPHLKKRNQMRKMIISIIKYQLNYENL